jgi:hypothetical protein
MSKAKLKVNVWEALMWECPHCYEENRGPSWLLRGDVVTCESCKRQLVVNEHYADCRPQKLQSKRATL